MGLNVTDILLGGLAILSIVLAIISEENRIIAIGITFGLMTILVISNQEFKLNKLIENQKRLRDKLKIHEQLIDIKKEIALLKNGRK